MNFSPLILVGTIWAIMPPGETATPSSAPAPVQSAPAATQPTSQPMVDDFCPVDGDEAITRILVPIRQKYKMPAMAAAILTSEGIQAIGAVGVRKAGTRVPVTIRDQWHLGSDTKAMTAALVGRLVERGLLRWDSTVAEVFPDLASQFHSDLKNVTILQLLSHRAGIARDPNFLELAKTFHLNLQAPATQNADPRQAAEANIKGFETMAPVVQQRLEVVRQGLSGPPPHPPGSQWVYSNLGYVIVGAMVERVTGKTWEEEMQTELFGPLHMAQAGFGGLGTPGQVDQPWGHTINKLLTHADQVAPTLFNGPLMDNPLVIGPAGRVHCPLQDWANFAADQLRGARGEAGLLKPTTYKILHTPPFGGDYALGWWIKQSVWDGEAGLTHSGNNDMYHSNAWIAPKCDFAVLVCMNEGTHDNAGEADKQATEELGRFWAARALQSQPHPQP